MSKNTLAVMLSALAMSAFAGDKTTEPSNDPMAGWAPRPVTNETKDKKEIEAVWKSMHEACRTGDVTAAAAHVDFPVLMITDDSRGEAKAETWSRERWIEAMAPYYKPMPDTKLTTKPSIFMITDSLASVDDQWKMSTGNKTLAGRSSTLLVRKDGKWRIKSMVEGGWGDKMKETSQASMPMRDPSSAGAGSGEPEQSPETR